MKKLFIVLSLIFVLYACAPVASQMSKVKPNISKDNNAKVVFFRFDDFLPAPTHIARVGRVWDKETMFYVGQMYSMSGIIHSVPAGKHSFAISGDLAYTSFTLEAEEGKFYYVEIYGTPGSLRPDFRVHPINEVSKDRLICLNTVKWITPNDKAKSYFAERVDKFYNSWVNAISKSKVAVMKKEDGFDEWLGESSSGSSFMDCVSK